MIKFRFEHFVIAILVVILLLENCRGGQGSEQECSETNSVKVSEEIITKNDSVSNNNIKNREPQKVNVIETPEKVEIIQDPDKLGLEEKKLIKPAYRYQDTTKFDNAIIYSDILSEGRIFKLDLKTSINHLQRTIETTKKTTRQAGGLFFSPTAEYIPVLGFTSAGVGFTYINGSLGVGIGGFYDFRNNQVGFRLTVHKKIF